MKSAVLIVTITLLGAVPVRASVKAEAQVKAAKGSVQITLRIQKTAIKAKDSLWYSLELKNIGKKRLSVDDRLFFKNPYAVHRNSKMRYNLYLEVVDSKGKPLRVKMGNYRLRYDWEGPEGEDYLFTPEEKKEYTALKDGWKKKGMTEQEQSIAWSGWINELYSRKNREEDLDPAKDFWLEPGASTTTVAWSDRGPDDYPGRSDDDESLRQGYTELWIFRLPEAGKYRIRAVYDHTQSESTKKLFKKHGRTPSPSWVEFKTPFIPFEVLP